MIGPNLYDKYDDLLLNATLNKMEDITYCPRQSCGIPVMREVDDKMAVCSSCRFVFCIFCKMTYHGVEPCKLKSGIYVCFFFQLLLLHNIISESI